MNDIGNDDPQRRTVLDTLGSTPAPGHRRRRTLILVAAVVVVALGGWWLAARNGGDGQAWRTAEVHRGNLTVTVTATGNLAPTNEVQVGVELSGTVADVLVDYNDTVRVGQVLARLDTTRLKAQMLQSKAAYDAALAKVTQARATVAEASSQLERLKHVRKLSDNRVPSQSEYATAVATFQRAQADAASARAQAQQAEATLNVYQTDLSKAVIRSPINGIVLSRSVEPGQTVAASLQAPVLFTLAEDLTKMELLVDVDEADVSQVAAGDEATFTVDAYPDREFPARITQVRFGSQTVDGVVTYPTVLEVDNSSKLLRPGMTATAEIVVNKVADVLLVPNAALRFRPPAGAVAQASRRGPLGMLLPRPPHREKKRSEQSAGGDRRRVWVAGKDGQLTAVEITIGASDGSFTAVTGGGLKAGMQVVTDAVAKASSS